MTFKDAQNGRSRANLSFKEAQNCRSRANLTFTGAQTVGPVPLGIQRCPEPPFKRQLDCQFVRAQGLENLTRVRKSGPRASKTAKAPRGRSRQGNEDPRFNIQDPRSNVQGVRLEMQDPRTMVQDPSAKIHDSANAIERRCNKMIKATRQGKTSAKATQRSRK